MNEFLTGNTPAMKCARTVVQGVIGVAIAALPQLMGLWDIEPALSATLVALVMAVLSPVMAAMGGEADDDGSGE